MRKLAFVASMVAMTVSVCLTAAAGTTLTDGVLTFDTSDGDILYTDPIGADVTKIVKTGAGTPPSLSLPSPSW